VEQTRSRTLEQELARAMRTGPFSAVLHLALESSGLTLDEVRSRLAQNGTHVSMATLSYWRRGRSRPERPDSLRAVHLLEGVLGLPADALTAQLGPKRPRGRYLARPVGGLDLVTAFGGGQELGDLLRDVETPIHNGFSRLAVHDLYTVGPDREEVSVTTRMIVRAHADGVSRLMLIYRLYDADGRRASVRAIRGCRVGRLRSDPEHGFIAGDLILDRVLGIGDTAVVEFEASGLNRPGMDSDFFHRVFPAHVGEYMLQVQFSPGTIASRCFRYSRRVEDAPDRTVQEVWVGATGLAHTVALDVPPGLVGLRWEWE
jgi:hypothetical protein